MSKTPSILYKVIAGSRMYGLATETSDIDYRGFYKENIWQVLNRENSEVIVKEGDLDVQIWPTAQFFHLCEKFNSNVVEILWAPEEFIVIDSWQARLLRKHREYFITQQSFNPIIGFSISECRKALVQDTHVSQLSGQRLDSYHKYGFCVKNAAHALRLLDIGIDLIQERKIVFPLKNRDLLLGVKTGQMEKEQFYDLWQQNLTKLQDLVPISWLPKELNKDLIDSLYLECVAPILEEYVC